MASGGSEEWARQVVAAHLGWPVVHHDDGSGDSLYDLHVGNGQCPEVAIEVVRAVDRRWTETWNVVTRGGPLQLDGVTGTWMVTVAPTVRWNRLRPRLASLLRAAENGVDVTDEATSLGLVHWVRHGSPGDGQVHVVVGDYQPGGLVDGSGAALPQWVSTFLRAPAQADVLRKLQVPVPAREVFVIVGGGASWEVEDYLVMLGEQRTLPPTPPELPPPVTGVWISSGLGDDHQLALRWTPAGWEHVDARPT